MSVSTENLKKLREMTNVPLMQCKKALEEANNDLDEAVEILRKSGEAKAVSKSGRVATEGVVVTAIAPNGKKAVLIELNSETDFVANNELFLDYANALAEAALESDSDDVQVIMAQTKDGETLEATRHQLVQKLGENIQLRRIQFIEADGGIASYQHGRKIGVVVALNKADDTVGKDVAMHVAAVNPQSVRVEDLPKELVEKETAICRAQVDNLNKPQDIVEKILQGKVSKVLNENCLMGQAFVKEPSQTVEAYLKQNDNDVQSFIRFEVGEGMEKKVENFAEEVRKQVEDR